MYAMNNFIFYEVIFVCRIFNGTLLHNMNQFLFSPCLIVGFELLFYLRVMQLIIWIIVC